MMNTPASLRLSILDLSPVSSGFSSAQALQNTFDLAEFTEVLGYTRYWLAEHHNTGLLACSSPEILISQVAARTKTMRVGSGGVMLPNHAPLKVAENFRTLETLFPNRIDLGLGRAPGTDPRTAIALRGTREALRADDFPQQLQVLIDYFQDEVPNVKAMPAGCAMPPLWLLGSSDFSAKLAAQLGLGFAFAHHINQSMAIPSLRWYHDHFQPSQFETAPRSIISVSVVCADSDEEAELLASSANLVWLRFQRGGFHYPLPSVEEATTYPYSDYDLEFLEASKGRMFVGSPASVGTQLRELAQQSDVREIMVTSLIHNHEARKRSYELLAQEFTLKENTK